VAARGRGTVTGTVSHRLEWDYVVLDNAALRAILAAPGVTVCTDRVLGVRPERHGVVAELAAGSQRRAALVVDATGQRRAPTGGRADRGRRGRGHRHRRAAGPGR
jgi:hypothetical protein